ncbi:MAG: CPBP family intramembrane glutamic endopeptidase [Myxococcota bacterium]
MNQYPTEPDNPDFKKPELSNLDAPKPMGYLAVFLFTLGIYLFQILFAGIFFLTDSLFNLPDSKGFITIVIFTTMSLIWAAGAFFIQKVLFLPKHILNYDLFLPKLWGFVVLAILIPVVMFTGSQLDLLLQYLFPGLNTSSNTMENFQYLALKSPLMILAIYFLTVVIAPLTEELFFRGLLFRMLRLRNKPFFLAAVYTSIIFSLVHVQLMGLFLLTLVGIIACYLSEKSNSLLPSMLFHGFYNLIVVSIAFGVFFTKEPQIELFAVNYESTSQITKSFPYTSFGIIPGVLIIIVLLKLFLHSLPPGQFDRKWKLLKPATTSSRQFNSE